jgi:hypothetical protein
MEFELEPRPYFQLLHATFRDDGTDEEIDRTDKVMEWVTRTRHIIERVTSKAEMTMLGVVWEYWTTHTKCPTRESVAALVRSRLQPKVLLDLLEEYDKHALDLKTITHADMDLYLQFRVDDFEKNRLQRVLEVAKQITIGSIPNPAATSYKPLPPLTGTRDALNYVMERFQRGILINDVRAEGGLLSEFRNKLQDNYDQDRLARNDGKLFIPTGIPLIDRHMGGLRRKELNGVLGYTGQRKTAVVRTMAYNAAKQGFRVLHIPLESEFKEELTAYNVMHAHANKKYDLANLNRRRYDAGEMTDAEYTVFMDQVSHDFAASVGKNIIVYDPKAARTWADVKAVIERENYIHPLDLVILDYLTLLGDPGVKDQQAAKMAIIQDAKQLTLNTGTHGFCMVTPVQGNRKGYEDATANDGAWETTGIAQFSEMDKSLDNCFYVFTNDELSGLAQLKMGTCKHRRGANIPSTLVKLNINAGMIARDDKVEDKGSGTDIKVEAPRPDKKPNTPGVFFNFMVPK